MTVHILKLAVGVETIDHFRELQARRLAGEGRLVHKTRHTPRRRKEVLDGGSLYWVIGGFIQVRQRILDIETHDDPEGGSFCLLVRDPEVVRVAPQPRRPFQGWRYLEARDAPADLPEGATGLEDAPAEMVAELRELGLI
jgi:hypothetical protein